MSETIQHVTLPKVIHQELALRHGLINIRVPYYEYTPESVLENNGCRLCGDRPVLTDRTILANRPDIVLII